MRTFLEWIESREFTAAGHRTAGKLSDWIEKNKDYIRVQNGYGHCKDCVRIFLDPRAEDESRRTGSGLDLWGLWHLEDYGGVSRISGNSVVLQPLDEEGLVRKQSAGSRDEQNAKTQADFQSSQTGKSHSVVLVDGEYDVVPTASIEMEPSLQGKVVYTSWR